MGITDAEANPRPTEKEPESDHISRSSSAAGGKISFTRTEQERVYRESSPRPSIFSPRETNIGKMLDRLIGEYEYQAAAKENEITEIKSRIEDLKLLKQELKEQELKEQSE